VDAAVIRALSLSLGVVLFHRLIAGAEADLGAAAQPGAAAVLLFGLGLGLLSREEYRLRRDGIALAVLVPLRGPLASVAVLLLPAGLLSTAVGAVLSLLPVGTVLGRLLRPCRQAAMPTLLVGVVLGELAVALGVAGWLPVWLIGALVAVLLAAIALLTRPPVDAEPPKEPPLEPAVYPVPTLLLGATGGLLLFVLQRAAAAYSTPSPHLAWDATLVLLLPAALVAVPAGVLATEGWPRRVVGAVGALVLAFAILRAATDVAIQDNPIGHVSLSRLLHDRALGVAAALPDGLARALHGGGRYLDSWAWLVVFAGQLAAAGGVALGARRGRELGWMVMGAGLAALAPYAHEAWPGQAPGQMLLIAASLAVAIVPMTLLGSRGVLLLPLAIAPVALIGGEYMLAWRQAPDIAPVRRPGEFTVDACERTPRADVVLFLAPGRDAPALEGRQAYETSFTGVLPAFRFDEHGEPQATCAPEPEPALGATADESDHPEPEPRYSRGLRVGGVPLYAGDPPLGPEGSLGRLTRLFARPGPAFVTGLGAELLAADLHDAGGTEDITVSSPVPLGRDLLNVLLDDCGSSGWQAGEVDEPLQAARSALPHHFATVVVAPAPADLPGVSALLTTEHLERLSQLLAPGGRCLVWVDTGALGEDALAARLAAFGHVFGARSAAFCEPRELSAPGLLLVGWIDAEGAPRLAELASQLPAANTTGRRVRLSAPADLASLLVRDGPGLEALGWEGAVLSRSRPVRGSSFARGGWPALAALVDPQARLSRAVAGAPDGAGPPADVLGGLVAHAGYEYRVEGLNDMLLEIKPDVEWSAWEAEVACYERAAKSQPDSPLLELALAALLEPLALVGDYGRFAQAYTRCGGARLPSWRLALQEWWVQKGSLEEAAAQAAAERARQLAGITR
jgi:hypothetical protein